MASSGSINGSSAFQSLQKEYKKLERHYIEALRSNNELTNNYHQLEYDLDVQAKQIEEHKEKLRNSEALVKKMEADYSNNKELFERELQYYKAIIDELEQKVAVLTRERDELLLRPNAPDEDVEKYNKLLKDYRILQSNYELEKNSKLVLIDQVEYLTKEAERESHVHEYDLRNSIIHNVYMDEESDEESDQQQSQMLSCLVDDLQHNKLESSSPIKPSYVADELIQVSPQFQFPPPPAQFPPSPDPQVKAVQRRSLPVHLKSNTTSPLIDESEFVLLPLKLTNANATSFFDIDASQTKTQKRYSTAKPTHSRYNSHDIVPIKVEFEQPESMRSSSLPEREHNKFDIIDEADEQDIKAGRNSAFCKLNGGCESNRNSLLTSTTNVSSKRSSLIDSDITKQEIMKLKFELQSLRLHNEKLLSYIGFELQKQKKNIKKLSSKQSLNNLNKRKMEYSDAKLIEKSRDMLIHKKRVLRLVSINPILSKKYNRDADRSLMFVRPIGVGLLPLSDLYMNVNSSEERFSFRSDFIDSIEIDDDEDDYGFLKHNKRHSHRIFSSGINDYLNYDEHTDRIPKKYKSQVFVPHESPDSLFDTTELSDIEEAVPPSVFESIKHLLFGPKPEPNQQQMVDDHLKYKFLSIAFGIMLVGIRCSSYQKHVQ